jgi:hypothetical protein
MTASRAACSASIVWGTRSRLATAALVVASMVVVGRFAGAEDAKPAAPAAAGDEDPPLEGEAKKKYDADMD